MRSGGLSIFLQRPNWETRICGPDGETRSIPTDPGHVPAACSSCISVTSGSEPAYLWYCVVNLIQKLWGGLYAMRFSSTANSGPKREGSASAAAGTHRASAEVRSLFVDIKVVPLRRTNFSPGMAVATKLSSEAHNGCGTMMNGSVLVLPPVERSNRHQPNLRKVIQCPPEGASEGPACKGARAGKTNEQQNQRAKRWNGN